MEPTNNPMPNPAPATPGAPDTPVVPVPPVAPTTPAAPVVPETPVTPAAPASNVAPTAPGATPLSVPNSLNMPEPVAPVVMPNHQAQPTMPDVPTPTNPVYQPGGGLVSPTDPITMPDKPAEPDPIEEELKAPLKAAAPVPGSIGSAVSGPQSDTPNVAFNDPAAMAANPQMGATNKPASKGISKLFGGKLDKKSLIMLCAIAGIVVVALAVVLIMQLSGGM